MNQPLWADFRSDACTLPTPAMRTAMAAATVGNDDFAEDPTISRLERRVATLLGKPAALFVQSGTMGNLVALLCHLNRGETLLTSGSFHIDYWEGDAVSRIVGAGIERIPDHTEGAWTTLVSLPTSVGSSRLLCLETPVNRHGGTLLPLQHMQQLRLWASRMRLPIHLDGARFFNASVALGITPSVLADTCDTVTVSFNKALSAPAGAILSGSFDFIARARRFRWMLGGAWKQGGVLAAACDVGLDDFPEQIAADHQLARELAAGLNDIPDVAVNEESVATNIVLMRVHRPDIALDALRAALHVRGIGIGRFKEGGLSRLVCHRDITRESVSRSLDLLASLLRDPPADCRLSSESLAT